MVRPLPRLIQMVWSMGGLIATITRRDATPSHDYVSLPIESSLDAREALHLMWPGGIYTADQWDTL